MAGTSADVQGAYMEVRGLAARSTVLIVDRSAESREVLRTALELRGVQIFEAARADDGLALARQHRPDMIVLDLDAPAPEPDPLGDELAVAGSDKEIPILLLGTARRRPADAGNPATSPTTGRRQFV